MDDSQPVFIQIIRMIEDDIIAGVYKADDLIVSTTQIAKIQSVNPTTAVKAVSKLTDAGVLYKRRGIGMCVAPGAREAIIGRRRESFLSQTLPDFLSEARTLGITGADLLTLIQQQERKNHD
ncbi:MAG: GntR family transcriptional regulator [Propionibacteriaceae bacterium]|jgi:DNA-binding transcriptional regulator YhcF (GntR family)|nr:GntR family transcriptional regulator [Propionibacteriaceae bacterium]